MKLRRTDKRKYFVLPLLSIVIILIASGCDYHSSLNNVEINRVEILDAYCLPINSSHFSFRFSLNNPQNKAIKVSYFWSLNDPKADFPGFAENINDPLARVYQNSRSILLNALETKDIIINLHSIREYDARFYVMYINVYYNDNLVGSYRGQKSTYKWDYSTTPPIPIASD